MARYWAVLHTQGAWEAVQSDAAPGGEHVAAAAGPLADEEVADHLAFLRMWQLLATEPELTAGAASDEELVGRVERRCAEMRR